MTRRVPVEPDPIAAAVKAAVDAAPPLPAGAVSMLKAAGFPKAKAMPVRKAS